MSIQTRRILPRLVRNLDAGGFFELFLVAAVASLLTIRFYLHLANYPQVGGHGLHIAHMLWGGLLMLVAIVLLLGYLGRRMQYLAALIGGIGFGTFIDELGKFITSDNNYFFQPTIAIIYVLFVLLILVMRALERRRPLSEEEYLANALDLVQEAVLHPLHTAERDRALLLLQRSGSRNPVATALTQALQQLRSVSPPSQGLLTSAVLRARGAGQAFVRWRPLHRIIEILMIVHGVFFLVLIIALIVLDAQLTTVDLDISLGEGGQLFATLLSSVMVLFGVLSLPRSRPAAYRWFKRSILVSIFLVQVFAFYEEQLAALVGLSIDLVFLAVLDAMLAEQRAQAEAALIAGVPQPAVADGSAGRADALAVGLEREQSLDLHGHPPR